MKQHEYRVVLADNSGRILWYREYPTLEGAVARAEQDAEVSAERWVNYEWVPVKEEG